MSSIATWTAFCQAEGNLTRQLIFFNFDTHQGRRQQEERQSAQPCCHSRHMAMQGERRDRNGRKLDATVRVTKQSVFPVPWTTALDTTCVTAKQGGGGGKMVCLGSDFLLSGREALETAGHLGGHLGRQLGRTVSSGRCFLHTIQRSLHHTQLSTHTPSLHTHTHTHVAR